MSRLPDDWLTVVMNSQTETQVPDYIESERANESVHGTTFYQQLRDCALNKLNNYPYNNAKQVRVLNATVQYCNQKIQESLRQREPIHKPRISVTNPYVQIAIAATITVLGGLIVAFCAFKFHWLN